MKIGIADVSFFQFACYEAGHTFPLTEHDYLFLFISVKQCYDDIDYFIHFRVVTGLLVENEGAVAQHSHLRKAQHQAVAVSLREKSHPLPFVQYTTDDGFLLIVHFHLCLCHGDEQVLVLPAWQLEAHLLFRSPD